MTELLSQIKAAQAAYELEKTTNGYTPRLTELFNERRAIMDLIIASNRAARRSKK